jgi:hypothetical protein
VAKLSQVISQLFLHRKSEQFHAIFCLAFLELYGDEVCSMNRLVLTDEEDAEYRSFE